MGDRPLYASDVDAIVTAAYEGNFELVRALFEEGANLDAPDESGATAVIAASEHGYDAIIKFLLDNGADVNAKDSDGDTALDIAQYHGRASTVQMLMEHGGVGKEGESAKQQKMDAYYDACDRAKEIKLGREKP